MSTAASAASCATIDEVIEHAGFDHSGVERTAPSTGADRDNRFAQGNQHEQAIAFDEVAGLDPEPARAGEERRLIKKPAIALSSAILRIGRSGRTALVSQT
jgi:hypothetical protein